MDLESVSVENFKNGMRRLAGAVTIITTDGVQGKAGITASAVSSVSDAPPTLLACINKDSEAESIILKNKKFTVNILESSQVELSNHFAGFNGHGPTERFKEGKWKVGEKSGCPILEGALVSFECELSNIADGHTHSVFFGRIIHINIGKEDSPLMYFDGSYQTLAKI